MDIHTLNPLQEKFAWNFGQEKFESIEGFTQSFLEYQVAIKTGVSPEDFVLLDAPKVLVTFMGVDPAEGEYNDMEIVIESENGKALRFFDFIFQLNNKIYPFLEDADHTFYEGLELEGTSDDGLPVISVNQGS